jgi:hypothetical protein
MGMKEISCADVLTINAKDPALYQPLPGESSDVAVIIDIDPDGLQGVFAGHPCAYAQWNVNSWLIRPAAQLAGFTIYNRENDTFHFHNGVDLTWPITVGEVTPPEEDPDADPSSTGVCDTSGRRRAPKTSLPGSVTKTRGGEFMEERKKEQEKENERVKRDTKSERERAEKDSKKREHGRGGKDPNVEEDEITKIR